MNIPCQIAARSGVWWMMRRLVSFLGVGTAGEGYQTARHCWTEEGAEPIVTPFVARALAQWSDVDQIAVVGTRQSFDTNGAALEQALAAAELPTPLRIEIDARPSPESWWDFFEKLKGALRGADEVILDITHGFRAFPFFAGAVVFFVVAIDEQVPRIRVVYSQLEGGDATIWELTEMVDLVAWTLELRLFLRSGQTRDLAARAQALGNDLARRWALGGRTGEKPALQVLAKLIADFGDAFAVGRTGRLILGEEKPRSLAIVDLLERSSSNLARSCPPIGDVLDRLADQLRPLCAISMSDTSGRRAVAALCELYLETGRPAQALELLREGWISLYADDERGILPGAPDFDARARQRAERRWFRGAGQIARSLGDLRNQVAHAGYRPQSGLHRPDRIDREIRSWIDQFRATEAQIPETGDILVNLSDRPSATWSAVQRRRALALASRIVDIGLPGSPPTSRTAIDQAVTRALADVPPEAEYAVVSGQLSLGIALIAALRRLGLTCLIPVGDELSEVPA